MVDSSDMSTPVTRGELREEIVHVEIRLDGLEIRLDGIDQRLAQMATKADLAQLEAKMATKADLAQFEAKMATDLARLEAKMATKADLAQLATQMATNLDLWGGARFERLLTELARHTKASQEALSTQISTIDDKYADLPARVSHLETAVFAPKQR
jgi:chromosome segregation ATPase